MSDLSEIFESVTLNRIVNCLMLTRRDNCSNNLCHRLTASAQQSRLNDRGLNVGIGLV